MSSFSFVKSDKLGKINRITDDNWDPTLYFESYTPLLGSAQVSGQIWPKHPSLPSFTKLYNLFFSNKMFVSLVCSSNIITQTFYFF